MQSTLIRRFLTAAGKIIAFRFGVGVLGGLFAPPLYWLGQASSQIGALHFLKGTDFQRYFARSILISAFLLLPLVIRSIGLERFRDMGLRRNPLWWRDVIAGLILAVAVTAALGFVAIQFGIYTWKSPLPWNLVAAGFLPALTVSVIEEFLFRGAILGLVRQPFSTVPALVRLSVLFSIIHFFRPV